MSLVVIHHPKTRHVLAAIAGPGLPGTPQLDDLAGPGGLELHQRLLPGTVEGLVVPSDALAVAVLDKGTEVPAAPLTFALDAGGQKLNLLTPAPSPITGLVSLTATDLTVTATAADTGADVIVLINTPAASTNEPSTVLTDTLPATKTVVFPVALAPGSYLLLVLVTGLAGALVAESLP